MKTTDDYVLLIQALKENRLLLTWFLALASLPADLKHSEIGKMTNKMEQANEQEELITLFKSLNNERIFFAVLQAVKSK